MTIGELSRKAGVSVQAIRYYERLGLLPRPHRWRDSGYRDFDDDSIKSLRFICSAKSVGFTLSETKKLLELRVPPRGSCTEVTAQFAKKITELDARTREIQRMKQTLVEMVQSCQTRRKDDACLALWSMEGSPAPKLSRKRRRSS